MKTYIECRFAPVRVPGFRQEGDGVVVEEDAVRVVCVRRDHDPVGEDEWGAEEHGQEPGQRDRDAAVGLRAPGCRRK